jgi:ABC-type Fe3+-hydroxamate transport system substrate-binding protein
VVFKIQLVAIFFTTLALGFSNLAGAALAEISAPIPTHHYSRVITLAPVLAEWTAELLGEKETQSTLIAVSEYSLYPKALTGKPTIGAYFKLNVEKIAALKPDLIIASSVYNRPEQIEQLQRLHLPVEILPAEKFSDMPAWIKKLGEILNENAAAARATSRWSEEVRALGAKKKKIPESLFLEVQHDPLVTIGAGSFLNEAFSLVGFDNIFKTLSQDYPKVSKESVLAKNPTNIFILDLTGNPKDFAPAVTDWEKFGKHPRILPGDDFARCSFALLRGLRNL